MGGQPRADLLSVARIGEKEEFLFRLQLGRLCLKVRSIALKIVDGLFVDRAISKVTRFFGLDAESPNLFEVHSIGHDQKTRMT